MDYELTAVGCSRLAESTLEEREKATEKVIKNLEEHSGYYSALIQFETGMNHANKIDGKNFKTWLKQIKCNLLWMKNLKNLKTQILKMIK